MSKNARKSSIFSKSLNLAFTYVNIIFRLKNRVARNKSKFYERFYANSSYSYNKLGFYGCTNIFKKYSFELEICLNVRVLILYNRVRIKY